MKFKVTSCFPKLSSCLTSLIVGISFKTFICNVLVTFASIPSSNISFVVSRFNSLATLPTGIVILYFPLDIFVAL